MHIIDARRATACRTANKIKQSEQSHSQELLTRHSTTREVQVERDSTSHDDDGYGLEPRRAALDRIAIELCDASIPVYMAICCIRSSQGIVRA